MTPIPQILDELRAGRMIVLVDDEHRENEGDLVCPAQSITPDIVNFMLKRARGILCVALDPDICDSLGLTPQSPANTAQLGTALTVTVDAHPRFGVTTGVSSSDRSTTIRLLADPATQPADLARPGHINPIRARPGGVLVRTGQTEGSVDLCKLAGLRPAAAIIEVMNDDGSMARLPQLQQLCDETGLKMCSVADIVAYRTAREKLVQRIAELDINTPHGPFRLIAYRSHVDPLPHLALCKGRVGLQPDIPDPVLVRVHPQNILGDVFADLASPTRRSLDASLRMIQQVGEGALVYIRQDPHGANLLKQLQSRLASSSSSSTSLSTPAAPASAPNSASAPAPIPAARDEMAVNIGIGSQILRDLGLTRLNLLTTQPAHYHALDGFGLAVCNFIPITDHQDA